MYHQRDAHDWIRTILVTISIHINPSKPADMRSSFILAFHLTLNVLASNKTWYMGFPDKRPFTVHTTRFLCAGHPNYTIVEQCKLKLHRNKPSAITFRATFLKPLEPVVGSMKIWYKTNVNIWRPLLGIDEWNHACDFLTAKYEDLDLMQKIYRRSLKHMLPHLDVRCPLQQGATGTTWPY
ncbi:uncharacterized protein LOC109401081 [Aedes albopictus]|uniref:Uncharacterized protein n=1 Tax=Aedes albopictus TaxID=7160 RepID=A0ABM1Z2T2_AEDAL